MESTLSDPVFLLASGLVPKTCPDRETVIRALHAAYDDPEAPSFSLRKEELRALHTLLEMITRRGVLATDEALLVSRLLAKRVIGWNPFRLPPFVQVSTDGAMYLALSNAVGVLCLTWQIRAHPSALILTRGDLVARIQAQASMS